MKRYINRLIDYAEAKYWDNWQELYDNWCKTVLESKNNRDRKLVEVLDIKDEDDQATINS